MNMRYNIIYWLFVVATLTYIYRIIVRNYEKNSRLVTNYTVVTYFNGIERYYRSLRWQRLESPLQESCNSEQRALVKKTICKNIFGATFFELRQEEYFDPETIRSRLMDDYPDIFAAIYNNDHQTPRGPRLLSTTEYEYENAYKLRTIRADGVLDEQEYTIVCPVVQRGRSGPIREYFVSREYDVNLVVPRPLLIPIYGRFVFSRPSRGDAPLRLVALAEEPAVQLSALLQQSLRIEALYATTRHDRTLAETPDRDPVCGLTSANKLRLCAVLFGASAFRQDGVKFVPVMANVDVDCVRKRVVFLSPVSARHRHVGARTRRILTDSPGTYEDWMIGCRALSAGEGEQLLYYVSTAEVENEVFVFRPFASMVQDERVVVHNYFRNVSVAEVSRRPQRFLTDDVED